jgi:protein-L-isoaspartate(D-aspartate) O-methyltransferase
MRVIGPESLADPNLAGYDWSLLSRYQPIARKVASQAEIYLSRGCPFDCAFCMERAKRDVSWRALEPERAIEEIHRLDAFVDLSSWTLFIADALFGMRAKWRKTFLEGLARRPSRARKTWLLIRVDLIDREDLELMARANVSPGFGLESGDPEHLKRIRKAGKLDDYLDKMLRVAGWARELDVPFGANVIVGHPGETEQSMRTSAAYLRKLFLDDPRGTTGFLSVDPFRLYPGSPIDEELDDWRASTGMKVHRYPWWHDGDQDFLAEWVDPSDTLDFRRALTLKRELFDPIVCELPSKFVYDGPAVDYYRRAIDEQVALASPRRHLHTLGMWHLWRDLLGVGADALPSTPREDDELTLVARQLRRERVDTLCQHAPIADAIEHVPRERFVAREHIPQSADDVALPLSDDGGSTLSAFHAYVTAFEALDLALGDRFADLGGGSGYGAALASEIVGPEGRVSSIEIEPSLAQVAHDNLGHYTQTRYHTADAHDVALWRDADKIYVGFALSALPEPWRAAMRPGAMLVAPIANGSHQTMTLFHKSVDGLAVTTLGPVRYVADRSSASA